jgi:hypothetical protein
MRFLKELFSPRLKCDRVGHKPRTATRFAYAWPSELCGVADEVEIERVECRRCRERLAEDRIIDREEIHSLEMPTSHWRELRKNGILYKDERP